VFKINPDTDLDSSEGIVLTFTGTPDDGGPIQVLDLTLNGCVHPGMRLSLSVFAIIMFNGLLVNIHDDNKAITDNMIALPYNDAPIILFLESTTPSASTTTGGPSITTQEEAVIPTTTAPGAPSTTMSGLPTTTTEGVNLLTIS